MEMMQDRECFLAFSVASDGIDEAGEGRKDLEWLTNGLDRCSELLNVGPTNVPKESPCLPEMRKSLRR